MSRQILTKPVISEKSFALQENGKYVFHVAPSANKASIKAEVEKMFKVNVINVQTVRIPGKLKRFGRIAGRRSDIKKAIVTLKKGQKIEDFK